MEQQLPNEPNPRTPFSGEAGQQIPPLNTSESKTGNTSSPEMEGMSLLNSMDTPMGNAPNSGSGLGLGGAGGVQQPKVQTAFIHKLYNMLEDANIQHLISWSPSSDSFVVQPTGEFSKVLSQYFKHTNISSFVRQLNMYGFHKVNDVFHTGSPDSTLWEFKHGGGSFKRGDLVGLRDIKRRASRHALIHRDSFPGTKSAGPSVPGTPNEQPGDSIESRMMSVEGALFEINQKLARTEDNNAMLSNRCQTAIEGLTRCHQWTIDLSQFMTNLFPADAPILREINSMQKEIERHTHLLEEPQEQLLRERQPEILANYEIQQHRPPIFSSQTTPPLSETASTNGVADSPWTFGAPPKFVPREVAHTAPPTRRSSLASSSVHALLNPTDHSSGEDARERVRDGMSDGEPEDRNKRKRIQ
ncbi:Flocculation suppression protein [Maublancomyces gigas]|uniref:Flocculation suppression protein n=1 Tax=Discina gigas TaxID=1032678 RepID=A0ABR3GCF6_9PEZI